MFIKCWGSRGSIPVSGKMYVNHGGDTTCMEIRAESGELIIVDAGTGIRRLGNDLILNGPHRFHMIFTHVHWDHVMGFPFFKPIYNPHFEITMYRCPFSKYLKTMLDQVMKPPYFPVRARDLQAKFKYKEVWPGPFRIGSIEITSIHLSHPNTGTGFKFTENGRSFVFITDNELFFPHPQGLSYEEYIRFSQGADLLIHDGEYTREEYQLYKGFGHSTYEDALRLGLDADVARLGLFHLNQDRTDTQMRLIVKECRKRVRQAKSRLDCFAVKSNMTFQL